MPRYAPSQTLPSGRASTVQALRLVGGSDPALQQRAAAFDQKERFHADAQALHDTRTKHANRMADIAEENMLLRKLGEELKQQTAAAGFAKQVFDLQQKVNGTHQLTRLFVHMAELDPADPDYGTQVAQLRLSYPFAAILPQGNQAIEAALKAAIPSQKAYEPLRALGDLSAFTKRGPNGEFLGFNLKTAQDTLDDRNLDRAAKFGDAATITQQIGGATIHGARHKALDTSGIAMTPQAAVKIDAAGKQAGERLAKMLSGDEPPLPGMMAEVIRAKLLTPERQAQWIDDHAHEAMQQAANSLKAEQSQGRKLDIKELSAAHSQLRAAEKIRRDTFAPPEDKKQAESDYDAAQQKIDSIILGDAEAQPVKQKAPEESIRDKMTGGKPPAGKLVKIATDVVKKKLGVDSNLGKSANWKDRPELQAPKPQTSSQEDQPAARKESLDTLKSFVTGFSKYSDKSHLDTRAKEIGDRLSGTFASGLNPRDIAVKEYESAADLFHGKLAENGIGNEQSIAAHQHVMNGGTLDVEDSGGTPTLIAVSQDGTRVPILPPSEEKIDSELSKE